VISRRSAFSLALSLAAFAAAGAQSGTITIAADTATTTNIAPGAKFTVPVIVDMSAANGLNVASLTTRINWTPARLTLDSIHSTGAGFDFLTSTLGAGTATVAGFGAHGTTATTTIAVMYFTAGSGAAGSRVSLTPTVAGNESGTSITSHVAARNLDVCVAPQTPWGDANGDGVVDIIDAQQAARNGVQLSVSSPASIGTGDVTADGNTDIVDAQQIASYVVGLSVNPGSRLGQITSLIPAIASVTVQPISPDLGIGQTAQLLAVPADANGAPLVGCTSLSWNSTNTATATVDPNGILTALASGSSTITATTFNGSVGSASLTVSSPISTLTISRDTATIHLGEVLALTATARDQGGSVMSVPITFTSSDSSIATIPSVGQVGQVTSLNVGLVTITARSQGKTASTTIQVAPRAENSLASGDDFSCMLSVTGAAYCWGGNASSQLGDGSTTGHNTPVAIVAPSSLRFTQIIAADKGACALSTTQAVYCWGARFPTSTFTNPFLSSGTLKVKTMAGWGSGTDGGICMIDVSDVAYCSGDGSRGQMGAGFPAVSNSQPSPVSGGLQFQSLTASVNSVCALSGTSAYCWGNDVYNQLGSATPGFQPTPEPVIGGLSFASIVSGRSLTCGVAPGGAGYCWGTGFYGGDGDGNITQEARETPTAITGGLILKGLWGQAGSRDVSASCGLTLDGTAYCWGSNSSGQLGTMANLGPIVCATGPCTGTPQLVATQSKFVTLRPGGEHACGITVDHTVLCWGLNSTGQLGDGSVTNRATPVLVVGGVRVP
jgi:alpha-tubulin suppressor-like RCC1 family protein